MKRAIRQLLNQPEAAVALLVILFMQSFVHFVGWWAGIEIERLRPPMPQLRFYLLTILVAAGAAGFATAALRHPVFNASYMTWLISTPWTRKQPLPLGPIHIGIRRAGTLAALVGLSLHTRAVDPIVTLCVFGATYLAVMMIALALTKQFAVAYAIALGFGAILQVWEQPHWVLAMLCVLYVGAMVGLRRSMELFPWDARDSRPPHTPVGQMFTRLSPKRGEWVSCRDTVAIAVFVGWWVYSLSSVFRAEKSDIVALYFVGAVAAFIRFMAYALICLPPISLLGRFATGRLIIPRYDHVIIAPLVMALSTIAIVQLLPAVGLSAAATIAIGCAVTLAMFLILPPTPQRWQLTSPHRYIMPRA